MSRFKQRVNEHSSITPSGFAGYIVKNSNVIIDKSYIEKGTSFINVFDNSNALLRDCASPYPKVESVLTQYAKFQSKLENEVDRRTLPFWLHYTLGKNNNWNYATSSNEYMLERVNENLNNLDGDTLSVIQSYYSELYLKPTTIDSSFTIERYLLDKDIDTKNINTTLSGTMYLSNIESSIKAVFPLNASTKLNVDVPKLLLNLKERQFLPILNVSNEKYELQDIYRYDRYGRMIENNDSSSNGSILDNTDYSLPAGAAIESYVHKPIAVTRESKPAFLFDSNNNKVPNVVYYSSINLTPYLEISRVKIKDIYRNYFNGPFIDLNVTYRKFDFNTNTNYLVNVASPLNFYTKFNNITYNLFDWINEPSASLIKTNNDKAFFNTYLKSKLEKISGYLNSEIEKTFEFPVNQIKIEDTIKYQPDENKEDAYFIGLTNEYQSNNNNLMETGKIYYYDSNLSSYVDSTYSLVSTYFDNYLKSPNDFLSANFYYSVDEYNRNCIYSERPGFYFQHSNDSTSTISAKFLNHIKYRITEICDITYRYTEDNLSYNIYDEDQLFTVDKELSTKVGGITYYQLVSPSSSILNEGISSYISGDIEYNKSFTSDFNYYDGKIPSETVNYSDQSLFFTDNIINEFVNNCVVPNKDENEKISSYDNFSILINDNNEIKIRKNCRNISYFIGTDSSNVTGSVALGKIYYSEDNKVYISEDSVPRYIQDLETQSETENITSIQYLVKINHKYWECAEGSKLSAVLPIVNSTLDYSEIKKSYNMPTINGNRSFEHSVNIKNMGLSTFTQSNISACFENYGALDYDFFEIGDSFQYPSSTDRIIQLDDIALSSLVPIVNVKEHFKNENDYTKIIFTKDPKDLRRTFILTDFLKASSHDEWYSQKYLSGTTSGYSQLYISPGTELSNPDYLRNDSELDVIVKANSTNNFEIDTNNILEIKYNISVNNDLLLYYDQGCKYPIRINQNPIIVNQKYGYELLKQTWSNNSARAVYKDETNKGQISDSTYVSFYYETYYQYEFTTKKTYQYEFLKGWYNINAYINYDLILNNYKDYYVLSTNPNNNITYTESSLIDDNIIEERGYSARSHVGMNSTNYLKIVDGADLIGRTSSPYTIASFFNENTDDNKFSYKLFSFNFKIPKYGWNRLNDLIYKQNPYYNSNILLNSESSSLHPVNALDILSGYASTDKTFNGKFSFLYLVLNNKVTEKVIGSGNYGNGEFVDANGQTHTGAKINPNNYQLGGDALSGLSAYIPNFVEIDYSATLIKGGTMLSVSSSNTSFSFTVDFSDSIEHKFNTDVIKYRMIELHNVFTTLTINNILHNIIIPTLKLFVCLKNESVLEIYNYMYEFSDQSGKICLYPDYSVISGEMDNAEVESYIALYDNFKKNYSTFKNQYATSGEFITKWRNIGPSLTCDENNFFYTWIPQYFVNFRNTSPKIALTEMISNNILNMTTVLGKLKNLSSIIPFSETFNGYGDYQYRGKSSISGIINASIYDAEEFYYPRDISTNLFYYKASPTNNVNSADNANIDINDEVILINARKMYSEPDETDYKPISSKLSVDFADLEDTDIILTSKLLGTEEELLKYFTQRHVYVTDDLKYSSDYTGNNKECRYTDAHSEGLQWNLFELNKDVKFTTSPEFEIPLKQHFLNNYGSEVFNVPCKMTIKLSGLIFQQQCRYGVEFDNINNVLFDQRALDGSVFGLSAATPSADIPSEIQSRFGLLNIGETIDGLGIPSAVVDGVVSSNTNYYLIKKPTESLEFPSSSFGGSGYFNDFYEMKINQNSANKWKTYHQKSRLSKLLVYPDYNPRSDRIIGIPYLNEAGKIILQENVITGETGAAYGQIESLASLVKIAEDDAHINPFDLIETDIVEYPTENDIKIRTFPSYNSFDGSNLSFTISGTIGNYNAHIDDIGLYKIPFNEANFRFLSKKSSGDNSKICIYFDGLAGFKEVYLENANESFELADTGTSTKYMILGMDLSFVNLSNNDGDGIFKGEIHLQIGEYSENKGDNLIQIHNFKLPSPILTSFKFSFTDEQINNKTYDGFYVFNDDIWEEQVLLPDSNTELYNIANVIDTEKLKLFSTSQPGVELSGNSTVLTDDDGNVSGLLLTIKIPGFKLFKSSGMKYILESPQTVTLSSSQMLSAYLSEFGINDGNGKYYLSEYYNPNATIGSQVLSGTISNTYNHITTGPFEIKYDVGLIKFRYNPPDDDKFQLEVVTKKSGSKKFNKTLYYVNKPVDQWYNMALYKTITQSESGKTQSTISFLMNNVNESYANYISPDPGKIFRCFVANDSNIDGRYIKCDLGKTTTELSGWYNTLFPGVKVKDENIDDPIKFDENYHPTSLMRNWKSLYDIKFDKCQRTMWNLKYTNDPIYLSYSNKNLENEYKDNKRRNFDLFNISDSLNDLDFTNSYGTIKLFANNELSKLSQCDIKYFDDTSLTGSLFYKSDVDKFMYYNVYVGSNFNNDQEYLSDIDKNKNIVGNNLITTNNNSSKSIARLREILTGYYPRKVLFQGSEDNYVLKRKPDDVINPSFKGVELEISNIMMVSSPNLSFKNINGDGGIYANSYYESLGAVEDYESFFGNPQHRLPPVHYSNRLLDSDYATFIYDNTHKFDAINNYIANDNSLESIVYDFSNDPSKVSFVWGNSQVTRSESVDSKSATYISKLYWNKSAFNEYTSEVGSVYNYQDSQHVTNVVTIETGSITDRQCVLMPVINSPLEYEQRLGASGIVKVNDNIIATAALGYSATGYPKNGILLYNSNGNVTIDSTLKNYIFIEQNNTSNECVLGATVQKPVFTDAVQINYQSIAEKITFLPNPNVSFLNGTRDAGVDRYNGSNIDQYLDYYMAPALTAALFYTGSENAFGDYSNILFYNKPDDDLSKQYVYDYTSNQLIASGAKNTVMYFMNPVSITPTNDYSIDMDELNVFYDESQLDEISAKLSGVSVTTSMTTLDCFDIEGNLLSGVSYNSANTSYRDIYEKYNTIIGSDEVMSSFVNAPIFGAIWGNLNSIKESTITGGVNTNMSYIDDMEKNIWDISKNIYSQPVLDKYLGANISSVKFKISEENIKSAPIYIKISLLKYNTNELKFYWTDDPVLDIDLTTTYESKFGYDQEIGERIIEKEFIDDGTDLTHHVYGIRFIVTKIVPQNKLQNSCKINNIQIFGSNILNRYGTSKPVQDVYIRRADANYSDAYQIDCSEYIWRIPNSISEWEAVSKAVRDDESLEGQNALPIISDMIENLKDTAISNVSLTSNSLDEYISNPGEYFSRLNSFFISNKINQNNKITEVLSDNYLVDSDIRISWKYIDYVYIYYTCYSFNAKELLDMYFGDKIYAAVRAKLNKNIENLNLNSAFKNKYTFGGGIAVQKDFSLNTQVNTQAFNWKADVRTDTTTTYEDVYRTDFKQTDVYYKVETATVSGKRVETPNGKTIKKVLSATTTYTYSKPKLESSKIESTTHYLGTNTLSKEVEKHYLGSTLQNAKYSSVDNWTKSFSPRQIKYKIN